MNIGCFGAFNFDNYGDTLLGDINARNYAGIADEANVILFSPDYESSLTAPDAETLSACDMAKQNLDAVVVGGGDVLILAPTDERLSNSTSSFSASQWNWLLPSVMAKVNNLPLIINAPGVPYAFSESESQIIKYLHGSNSYVTARDPISASYLSKALGADVPIVPDPAFLLPELYDEESLVAERVALLNRVGIASDKPYVCIQCSPGFLKDNGACFLERIVEISDALGLQILMIPICYLWGDLDACREAAAASSRVKAIDQRLNVIETAALIHGSQWFLGSSLHGCLTSMAFGKPAILMAFETLTKFDGAAALYGDGLIQCTEWGDLGASLSAIDKIDPAKVSVMAERCRDAVKDHFQKAADFLRQNKPTEKLNNFHYDSDAGDLQISDSVLKDLLNTQQIHYLQSKIGDQVGHQAWMRGVVSKASQDLRLRSKHGALSSSDIDSVVHKLDSTAPQPHCGWFDGYHESEPIQQEEAEVDLRSILVSIVVPAYNCWELTKACVESIRKFTRQNYELIVIDDASDTDVTEKMAALADERTKVICNETRCSYSINNNKGVRLAAGKYVCLLNNDTLVTANWLQAMVSVLENQPDVGLVGNKHLFPESKLLHHCGMAFDKTGFPLHLHPNTDPEAPSVNYERDVPCVTFACVLVRKTIYKDLKGLDETYRNGFEDCDFCLRTLERGHNIKYVPSSVIYHYGQSSPDRTKHDNANWELFDSIWHGKFDCNFNAITKADRKWNRKVRKTQHAETSQHDGIHFAVDFSQGGAFTWAAADLIVALVHRGENVSVMSSAHMPGVDKAKRKIIRKLMRKKPYRAVHLKWSHYWTQYMRMPLGGDINAEFFCSNYRYEKVGRQLDLWMRHVQSSNHRWLPISGFNHDALMDVDVSPERCDMVPLGYAPEVETVLPAGQPRVTPDRDELHLLMITNSADLERYGADIAVKAFGRAFSESDPVVLHIKDYGAYSGSVQLKQWISDQPQFPKVVWHVEFLDKIDLMKLYADMDVLVAPFRGEGFGMKIIDAMALGVPVLMPRFGGAAEYTIDKGYLPLAFKEVPVGDCFDTRSSYIGKGAYWCEVDEDAFVQQLASLISQKDQLGPIGQHAREHVRSHYSWAHAADRLMTALQGWQTDRETLVAPRRQVSTCALTVIIPTLNREDILAQAFAAYQVQTLSADQYEILLVNDHGNLEKVSAVVNAHAKGLNVRLVDNMGLSGPAAARNLAIESSKGDIVLITGDDIIPDPSFLAEHLSMHKSHPDECIACVGNTKWHPDLEMTPFMQHLSGKGGQQFNYRDSKHGREVPFDRFYTSNVSLKRTFIIEEEDLFLTIFRFAAYEDVELAYRLHLRGMRLLYSEKAVGFHHHAMTPESFISRQRRVGRMLTVMSLVQPSYVPVEHTAFLESLEYASSDAPTREFMVTSSQEGRSGDPLVEGLLHTLEQNLNSLVVLNAAGREGVKATDAFKHSCWLHDGCGPIWDAINELVLREGMADEWAENGEDAQWTKVWVRMQASRTIVHEKGPVSFSNALFPPKSALNGILGSHMVFVLINKLLSLPVLGKIVSRMMRSRMAERVRLRLKR